MNSHRPFPLCTKDKKKKNKEEEKRAWEEAEGMGTFDLLAIPPDEPTSYMLYI
jgi:hypothetical protein